jgi:hypothetical protein
MNKKTFTMLAVGLVCGLTVMAQAGETLTAAQVEQRKTIQERLDRAAELPNSACGSKIAFNLDWSSLKGVDTTDKNLKEYCSEAFASALRGYCSEGDAQKKAVQKINTFTCSYAKDGKIAFDIKGGKAKYKFVWSLDKAESLMRETLAKQ